MIRALHKRSYLPASALSVVNDSYMRDPLVCSHSLLQQKCPRMPLFADAVDRLRGLSSSSFMYMRSDDRLASVWATRLRLGRES